MKKLPFALLFVLVIAYLCACGAAGPAVQAAITNPPAPESAAVSVLEAPKEATGQIVLMNLNFE